MANDLATLAGYLDTQLNDSDNAVWGNTEKENLLTWAAAGLYPRLARQLDPSDGSYDIPLVADTYTYSLPSGVLDVSQLFIEDEDGEPVGFVSGGAWEVLGDPLMGTGKVRVAPATVNTYAGGELQVYGYGRFDLTANYVPDQYIEIILAKARSEAYRRIAGDRTRFKVWLSRQQTQNSSVNELIQYVNEADDQYERLRARHQSWRRPVPGRI